MTDYSPHILSSAVTKRNPLVCKWTQKVLKFVSTRAWFNFWWTTDLDSTVVAISGHNFMKIINTDHYILLAIEEKYVCNLSMKEKSCNIQQLILQ